MTEKLSNNSFVEVDLGAVKHNLEALKQYVAPGTQQMAVVKADAYGHGAVKVSRAIQSHVDWLAVNDIDEGIALRNGGIDIPILVFGVPTEESAPAYSAHKLTATVSSIRHFDLLVPGTKYHLQFDTGMGRLGLQPDEAGKARKAVQAHSALSCTGIYSHLATSVDPGSPQTEEQIEMFSEIRRQFDQPLLTHLANTGGTAFYPESHFDMVRHGIGVYGYAPGATIVDGIKPALRWETVLAQVKPIERGQYVSYGARWMCREDGYLGILPVGYEEGIPRILTGNLEVSIDGRYYPVVGTVTMNYVMVYLKQENFEPGQRVEIMGGSALPVLEWANRAETITYEILTGISDRIERRYVNTR